MSCEPAVFINQPLPMMVLSGRLKSSTHTFITPPSVPVSVDGASIASVPPSDIPSAAASLIDASEEDRSASRSVRTVHVRSVGERIMGKICMYERIAQD